MTERKTKTPAGAEVKEIIWIDLTRTNNGAHYQFIKNVHENISAETELLTDTRIKAAADKLGEALKKEVGPSKRSVQRGMGEKAER